MSECLRIGGVSHVEHFRHLADAGEEQITALDEGPDQDGAAAGSPESGAEIRIDHSQAARAIEQG